MDHLSAAGSSATRNLTTTEPSESQNRRKTVDFRFQRPHATSGSFFFNKPMRAMDSTRDFTSKKGFPGYFSELGEKANPGLPEENQKKTKRKPKENQNECCSGSASALFAAPPFLCYFNHPASASGSLAFLTVRPNAIRGQPIGRE